MAKRWNWDGTVMWKECWMNVYQIVQAASLATKQHKTSCSTMQVLDQQHPRDCAKQRLHTGWGQQSKMLEKVHRQTGLRPTVKRYKVLEEISLHIALKLLLLLLSWWGRQVLPMRRMGSRRGEGTDAPKRWGIPPSCRCDGKHPICQWSHQSTVMYITL